MIGLWALLRIYRFDVYNIIVTNYKQSLWTFFSQFAKRKLKSAHKPNLILIYMYIQININKIEIYYLIIHIQKDNLKLKNNKIPI